MFPLTVGCWVDGWVEPSSWWMGGLGCWVVGLLVDPISNKSPNPDLT